MSGKTQSWLWLGTALLFGVPLSVRLPRKTFRWPAVQAVKRSFNLGQASWMTGKVPVSLTVTSPSGRPLYSFSCSAWNTYRDGAIDDFSCNLLPANLPKGDWSDSSLLSSNPQRTDVVGRAIFAASDLRGECGNYPSYGRVRHFLLRGMRLTISVKDPTFVPRPRSGDGGDAHSTGYLIKSFRLDVSVTPDPAALSAVAEPAAYRYPPVITKAGHYVEECRAKPKRAHIPGLGLDAYARKLGLGPPYPRIRGTRAMFRIVPKKEGGVFSWGMEYAPGGYAGDSLIYAPLRPANRVVYVPIYSVNGQLAYQFECTAYEVSRHNGSAGGPRSPAKIDHWGILCGLFPKGSKFNLLLDAVDLYSRMNPAEILPGQLYGKCANYPEWGAVRTFRLRGLRLKLRFSDAKFTWGDFAPHALTRVRLRVSVAPGPGATSPLAGPPKYIYWGWNSLLSGSCNTVLVPLRAKESE